MSEDHSVRPADANGDTITAMQSSPKKHNLGSNIWQVWKTIQARLRFFVLLAAMGGVILYWDTLKSYYEKWARPTTAQAVADPDSEYWCPMHPTIIRDHPDKCPICGMPLSKRKKSGDEGEALPPGVVSRVQLTPYRIALAGVEAKPVEYRELFKEITAAGFVEFDETKLMRITNHLSGRSRIDKLYVNVTDQPVAKGDPLALLYSPDLDLTMQNLLDAHRSGNKDLERMTRQRLDLWGIESDQIDQVLKTGKPITHLTIRSPASGHVLRKYQLEGDYIEEGARLFDVADLSTVWIEAQVYEDELAFLKPGLSVSARLKAFPNREFTGTLAFIHPHLDSESRTLKVRFDVENPGHLLRPGMYAEVALKVPATQLSEFADLPAKRQADWTAADFAVHALFAPLGPTSGAGLGSLILTAGERTLFDKGDALAVPERAVIDTGARKVVYREAGPSLYEGVEVELGPRCGDYYPVLRGLQAGDKVAGAGSFLIDAETRLTGGIGSTYYGASGGPDQKGRSTTTARPSTTADEDADVKEALDKLNPEDRRLANDQEYCPITGKHLGSMGAPVMIDLKGRRVFLCCSSCPDKAKADAQRTLDKVDQRNAKTKDAHGKEGER
jgi:membrane fusion protein, copper/silver efflux system